MNRMNKVDESNVIGRFGETKGYMSVSNSQNISLMIDKNVLPREIADNYRPLDLHVPFKVIIEVPFTPTRKIYYNKKLYNVVEEFSLTTFIQSSFCDIKIIHERVQTYPEFGEYFDKYDEVEKESEELKNYIKSLKECGNYNEAVFERNFDDINKKRLQLKKSYGSKLYYSFKRDYLSYSDSSVKDLTVIDGLRYFYWDINEPIAKLLFKNKIMKPALQNKRKRYYKNKFENTKTLSV